MQIDWGQVVTQMIGFVITVWLLKRYAWGKILGFMEKRRETIAASFEEIEKSKTEVDAQRERYEKELENIEATAREKLQKAAREAEEMANGIKDDARRDAIQLRDKAKQDVEIELDKANAILRDRMATAVFTATEKLLKHELDAEKHKKLIDGFLADVKVN